MKISGLSGETWLTWFHASTMAYSVCTNTGLSLGGPFSGLTMNRPKAVPQSHMRKGNPPGITFRAVSGRLLLSH